MKLKHEELISSRYTTFHGGECAVAVIEHSRNQKTGKDALTYQLKYPRFIHSEFMTHRALSKNAGSSRAIPTEKLYQQVIEDPAFFVYVGKNQPGMQAAEELDAETREKFYAEWKELANISATYARRWASDYNVHKQSANRVLEPFLYISVVASGTEWDNFFELRDHEDAQPEIRDLARTMRQAANASVPRVIHSGELEDARTWHLPYVTMDERKTHKLRDLLAMSAARCARVSYLTHDKLNPTLESDMQLYRRLVESKPLHASPLEHQIHASQYDLPNKNLTGGFLQHRTLLEKAGSLEGLWSYI
jgi:thymidylate synthase ThyX